MTTLLLRFRVADYDAWRPEYDSAIELVEEVRSHQVWRGQDDPNLIVLAETYDSRELAETLYTEALADPAIQKAIEEHGVDMSSVQIDYLDEVGPGTG